MNRRHRRRAIRTDGGVGRDGGSAHVGVNGGSEIGRLEIDVGLTQLHQKPQRPRRVVLHARDVAAQHHEVAVGDAGRAQPARCRLGTGPVAAAREGQRFALGSRGCGGRANTSGARSVGGEGFEEGK